MKPPVFLVASAAAAALALPAFAAPADRAVEAAAPVSVVYERVVATATDMCVEAAQAGETRDVGRCVDTLVAHAIAEARRADLTAYAMTRRPELAKVRLRR